MQQKIKSNHKNACILLVHIHIIRWCTVHTTLNLQIYIRRLFIRQSQHTRDEGKCKRDIQDTWNRWYFEAVGIADKLQMKTPVGGPKRCGQKILRHILHEQNMNFIYIRMRKNVSCFFENSNKNSSSVKDAEFPISRVNISFQEIIRYIKLIRIFFIYKWTDDCTIIWKTIIMTNMLLHVSTCKMSSSESSLCLAKLHVEFLVLVK